MKLAVVGTKEFTDLQLLTSILKDIPNIDQIISGGAVGTDTLAKQYASLNHITFLEFPPDHKKFGDKAKHIRDKLIVQECDELIAFWDGECEGTRFTMEIARKLGKTVRMIEVDIDK